MQSNSIAALPTAAALIEQTEQLLKATPVARKSKPRSRRGEGSVYWEASKKSWVATLVVKNPRPGDAKRRSFRVAGPPKGQPGWKEARDAAVAKRDAFAREAHDNKTLLKKGRRDAWCVAPWIRNWVDTVVRPTFDARTGLKVKGHAAATYTTTDTLVRLYIERYTPFERMPLSELDPEAVIAWLDWVLDDLASRGLSSCQAVEVRKKFVQAINYATLRSSETGLRWNPVAIVPAPEYTRPEVEALGDDQTEQLLTTAYGEGPAEGFMALLGLATGARRQELAGAQFGHVDLPNRRWKIQQKAQRQPVEALRGHPAAKVDGRRKKQPKTVKVLIPGVKMGDPTSFRMVPLSPEVIDELLRYRQWLADQARFAGDKWTGPDPMSPEGFIFPQADGDFICPMALYDRHAKVCKKAGVANSEGKVVTKMHQLRHEAITTAIKKGYAMWKVQALAGHKQLSTTMGTYAHFTASDLHDLSDGLGAHFTRGLANASGAY